MVSIAPTPDTQISRATMSVADFIAATGLSRGTVYDGIRRGEIPSVRVGRRILIPHVAFQRWLESCFTQPNDEAA